MHHMRRTNKDKEIEKMQSKVWDPRVFWVTILEKQHDREDG